MNTSTKLQIQSVIDAARRHASRTAIIAVINVKSLTKHLSDYSVHSMRCSFLNEDEANDIISGFRANGFFVEHFADEEDFFRWVLDGGPASLPHSQILVYTAALNGSGPGRRTLVPAFCSYFSLKTLNSDAYSCAINRHKFHSSRLLDAFGLAVPRTWYFIPEKGWMDGAKPKKGEKVIAKATYEGSSLGVDADAVGNFSSKVESRVEFLAHSLKQPITVQSLIPGFELDVPVIRLDSHQAIGAAALTLAGEELLDDTVLLYNDAWEDNYTFAEPSALGKSTIEEVQRAAERAAHVLNFKGICRIDFRVTASGNAYIIDVSSTPHLTKNNAVCFLFERGGMRHEDIFGALAGLGMEAQHGITSILYSSDQNSSSAGKKPNP